MHSSEIVDGVLVIHFNETRATLAHSKEFKEYAFKQIEGTNYKLLVDLRQSEYIDSTFMGAIIELYKKTDKAGGKMKIACNEKISYIICEVNHLSSFIEVFEDIDEAVKSFGE